MELAAAKGLLQEAAAFYARLPLPLLVAGHSLTVCAWFKRAHGSRYLLNYWVAFLAAFGGGMASAILIQDASKASIALLTKNVLGVCWSLCWWGMNYCPGDLVARLHALLPIRAAARACLCVLRSSLIVHRVGAAVVVFPGVLAAPLVLGTLSGSGGKVISDAIQAALGEAKELSQPSWSLWSAFLAALGTYLLVHATQLLSEPECLALVTSGLVAHGLACELTGKHLDPTEPLARAFHKVTRIPMPGHKSHSGKATPSNPATPTPSLTKQMAKGLDDDSAAAAGNEAGVVAAAGAAARATPRQRRAGRQPQNTPSNVAAAATTPGRATRRRRAAGGGSAGTSD